MDSIHNEDLYDLDLEIKQSAEEVQDIASRSFCSAACYHKKENIMFEKVIESLENEQLFDLDIEIETEKDFSSDLSFISRNAASCSCGSCYLSK